MKEREELVGRRISLRRSPLNLTVAIGPSRSLWAIVATPLVFVITELRLRAAIASLPYIKTLLGLGIGLGVFYVWWFCWNLFGRQELTFHDGDMTITGRLLGLSRRRQIRIGDITAIQCKAGGYRSPARLQFSVKNSDGPYAFGENLNRADLLEVTKIIAREIPMLAGKIQS